jgi:tRNA modification GTPase
MNFGTNADTICALSTANGMGAIAVVRVSGPQAISIVNSVFSKDITKVESHSAHFGVLKDGVQIIDEVLINVFHFNRSFTGEETVEISCHGSVFIQQAVLQLLLKNGCRMAEAGEFTMRAYMNGKFDLAQAEAIADLIASRSAAAHRMALTQMRGGVSKQLAELRQQLIDFVALIELELDFGEEDVEFADRTRLKLLIAEIAQVIDKLRNSFHLGNAIKNGIPVAIVGAPNVGKSTLLNALLNEEKAIVSDIPGTTRDFIEDEIVIKGVSYRFVDTAGLRETTDVVENLGIERSFKKAGEASVVLYLLDERNSNAKDTLNELNAFKNTYIQAQQEFIVVVNKLDLTDQSFDFLADFNPIFISAKSQTNLDLLMDRISQVAAQFSEQQNDVLISNARHFDALNRAYDDLMRVQEGMDSLLPTDLIAMDIRQVIGHIGSITGAVDVEEVLGSIFSKFCIGK